MYERFISSSILTGILMEGSVIVFLNLVAVRGSLLAVRVIQDSRSI
jgi:hypothetical protein